MGSIKAFLQPPVMNETKEVIVSKRFKDEQGKVAPFVIRVIDQETNNKLINQATKKSKKNGQILREFDEERYAKLLVSACVVEPNFKDSEICAHYKTVDPLDVPERMLNVGEYNYLVKKIRELNQIAMSDEDFEELAEEVKNRLKKTP